MNEITEWERQGCAVCRAQWSRGEHPRFIAVYPDLHERLYRCDACGTYWAETERYAAAVTTVELASRYGVDESRELDEAIAAYVGFGVSRTPTADAASLPVNVLRRVEQCVTISDTLVFEEVAPFDSGLRDRLRTRLRELLPEVGPAGIEALGWRWGYLQFR